MKRLPVLTLLLAALAAQPACASRPAPPETRPQTPPVTTPETRPTTSTGAVATAPRGSRVGAESPRAAVEEFLRAVRAQDLQAMGTVWGTQKGAARDQMPRDELEKRELVMQCFLSHERFRVLNDMPGSDGARVFRIELTRGSLTKQTNFTVVRGPGGRWFVESADIAPLTDFCRTVPGA